MRNVISIILFILLLSPLFVQKAQAQDPQFTQFYANPIYLNPAFAGEKTCPRLIMNYRNQWSMISGSFVTYNFSYDQHVEGIGGGLGILAMHDEAGEGTINTSNISGIYAYHLPVNRHFSIRAGFQATFMQKKLDWSKLTFGDQIDYRNGFIYETNEDINNQKESVFYPDFSAGIVGYSDKFYFGFAAHHLTTPNEGFITPSKLPRKYTAHVGGKFPLGGKYSRRRGPDQTSISPNILYQQQQDFQQLNYGIYVQKHVFVVGLWFRQNFTNPDAFIMLIGFQQSALKFGYSYDLTVSKLTNASGGSHEFSLAIQFPCRTRKPQRRAIQCPSF